MIVREDTAHHVLPTHLLDEAKTMKGGFGTDTVLSQCRVLVFPLLRGYLVLKASLV